MGNAVSEIVTTPEPVKKHRGPTMPQTYAKHLMAAGYLVIPPNTSLWRRLVLAWRGA